MIAYACPSQRIATAHDIPTLPGIPGSESEKVTSSLATNFKNLIIQGARGFSKKKCYFGEY